MEWALLLEPKRFRTSTYIPSVYDRRGAFENDFDRIVHSSPFRRLQDKTQVFPHDQNDFIRTRLTHSLEVSSIGRSIGLSVENSLFIGSADVPPRAISSILAVAGLIHDIGNPPFGHHGEKVFQTFYQKLLKSQRYDGLCKDLTDQQIADLQSFDGNPQSFRLLTRLQYIYDHYSYNLSFPVLATIMKYPISSIDQAKKSEKFGYFSSEAEKFEEIWDSLGIFSESGTPARHPLVYLLEAADDIAFSIADLEDGSKKGLVSFQGLLDIFEAKENPTDREKAFREKARNISIPSNYPETDTDSIRIQNLRIMVHAEMIVAVLDEFIQHQQEILLGTYQGSLLENSEARNIRRVFSDIAKHNLFGDKQVITLELMGDTVLSYLMEIFTDAVLSEERNRPRSHEGKIYALISDNYKYISQNHPSTTAPDSVYNRLLLVNDFVSGMTDRYAISLYQKLKGMGS